MTGRIYTTVFTIPANTPIATPATLPVVLDDEQLDSIEIIIPSGHSALTGIAILWSGVQIAPYDAGTWINGDDDKLTYDYAGEITANGLSLTGYNLDIYQHSFYLRWFMRLLTPASPVVITSPQAAGQPAPADVAAVMALTGGGG